MEGLRGLEWSREDAMRCWWEIMAIWTSQVFKSSMVRQNPLVELSELLEGEGKSFFGGWIDAGFGTWVQIERE